MQEEATQDLVSNLAQKTRVRMSVAGSSTTATGIAEMSIGEVRRFAASGSTAALAALEAFKAGGASIAAAAAAQFCASVRFTMSTIPGVECQAVVPCR